MVEKIKISCLFLQLAQQPKTVALGLILLHTTSEELACPREDLSVARKEELHRLLLQQVPTVLNVLNSESDIGGSCPLFLPTKTCYQLDQLVVALAV